MLLNGRASASASSFRCARSGRRYFLGVVGCAVVLGAVWIVNSYPWPDRHRRRNMPRRTASPIRRRRAVHRARHRHPGADRARRRHRHDLHRHPHALRPLCLRHGGNPEAAELAGINTKLADGEDLHADGRARRHLRRDLVGPPQLRPPTRWARSTSSMSSPPRSSAARRWPAASARSTAPCSARCSCSRCSRA